MLLKNKQGVVQMFQYTKAIYKFLKKFYDSRGDKRIVDTKESEWN